MNPYGFERDKSIGTLEYCMKDIDSDKAGKLKFTVHAHIGTPISESPDDVHIYSVIGRLGAEFLHFIADGFRVFRLK